MAFEEIGTSGGGSRPSNGSLGLGKRGCFTDRGLHSAGAWPAGGGRAFDGSSRVEGAGRAVAAGARGD